MRKIKLYIAISLDGYIARPNGAVDWLDKIPNPNKLDYDYFAFYESIDTTLMGNNTYKEILGYNIPFPYPDKTNYVFTRVAAYNNTEFVQYVNENVVDFVKALKAKEGKDIWLIGGSQLNTLLFNENLIDECWIFVMPIVIGEGIQLFFKDLQEKQLKLIETKTYETGVVLLKYK